MARLDHAFWRDKKVLVTGHTGFKGTWLSLLLQELGAHVVGVSHLIPTTPSMYESISWGPTHRSIIADIRDPKRLSSIVNEASPEIMFHLAAQSLVRPSYNDPIETFSTNVMGTVNLFEAARTCPSVRAVVNVTSDKCYENLERAEAYREDDRFGGHDPYSCSKGCAELVTTAYQRSFFLSRHIGLASVRGGNVIGGGDWSQDRLIPDCVRAFSKNEAVIIRNPNSIRPWQHVLDALRGYVLVAENLYRDPISFSTGFNFGPDSHESMTVGELLAHLCERWGENVTWKQDTATHVHEATTLRLNSSRAQRTLSWRPLLSLPHGLDLTVSWYKSFITGADMTALSKTHLHQIESLENS